MYFRKIFSLFQKNIFQKTLIPKKNIKTILVKCLSKKIFVSFSIYFSLKNIKLNFRSQIRNPNEIRNLFYIVKASKP